MATTALFRLGALTGRTDLTAAGKAALESIASALERQPAACGQSLIALDFLLGTVTEFAVIAGHDTSVTGAVLEAISREFRPRKVVAPATPEQAALLAGKVALLENRPLREGKTTTYVCENGTCREPLVGLANLEAALGK